MKRHNDAGFSLIEMVVAVTLLSIATAITVPVITRNRWKGDVDQYASQLESGLYGLRAKLGAKKTSCTIDFEDAFKFLPPDEIVEFSQNNKNNETRFQCCDSTIALALAKKTSGADCNHPGNQISTLTGNPLDNLRLVQQESSKTSKAVRVAITRTDFGFTPPGTTANAGTLTFLVCHNQVLSKGDPTQCMQTQNGLNIRCVQIDGTGGIVRGKWILKSNSALISSGQCQSD